MNDCTSKNDKFGMKTNNEHTYIHIMCEIRYVRQELQIWPRCESLTLYPTNLRKTELVFKKHVIHKKTASVV
jgi:hypothetical protein